MSEFDVVDVVAQLVDRSIANARLLPMAPPATGCSKQCVPTDVNTSNTRAPPIPSTLIREPDGDGDSSTLGLRSLGPDEELVLERIEEYLPDSLVALDWFIEHQDWEKALAVIFFGGPTTDARQARWSLVCTKRPERLGPQPICLINWRHATAERCSPRQPSSRSNADGE